MYPLLIGLQYGLFLSILVGPLLVALVQTGFEQGTRAGLMVGLGIWLSDLLFILSVYYCFSQWTDITQWPWFTITVGSVGALVLVATGIISLWKAKPTTQNHGIAEKRYRMHLTKGFLINTINPFTVFFWLFMMSSEVLPHHFSMQDAAIFFGAIFAMIVLTDSLKVVLAKNIRPHLSPQKLQWLQTCSGYAMIVFGLTLFARSLWQHQPFQ